MIIIHNWLAALHYDIKNDIIILIFFFQKCVPQVHVGSFLFGIKNSIWIHKAQKMLLLSNSVQIIMNIICDIERINYIIFSKYGLKMIGDSWFHWCGDRFDVTWKYLPQNLRIECVAKPSCSKKIDRINEMIKTEARPIL